MSYTYDAWGRRATAAAVIDGQADFFERYTHDALGRITRITQESQTGGRTVAPKRVDLGYTAAGLLEGAVRYDDLDGLLVVVSEDYGYDNAGRLTSLSQSLEAGATRNYSWVYDAANRIISYSTPTDSGAYDYNDLDELTEVLRNSLADETYSYDASGNRTLAGYVTGAGNRVLSDGTYNYQYDAEGRRTLRTEITTGITEEYTWDQRSRLTGIETFSSTDTLLRQVAYTYDAFDRRLSKSIDANGDTVFESVSSFVYDGMDVVAVLDGAGSVTNRYLHGPGIDQVFADERLGGEVLWALSDNLGSIKDLVQRDSTTGVTSVAEHLEYDAYGNIVSHTNGSGQAVTNEAFFAFTGREWDADADLYFYRARWYDPGIGRFVSEDPLGFGAGDVNVQRYVGNHPVNFTDPSGMISVAIADEHGSIIYGLDYFDQMTPAERSSLNSQMWNARLSDWLSSEAEMYEKFGIPVIRVKNPAAEFAAQQSQSGGSWGDMFNVLSTVVNSSLASVAIKPNLSAPAMAQAGPAQNPVCPPPHTDMGECAGWSVTDVALDGLSGIDALAAGLVGYGTFGWSNTLRAELYGEAATRNHQGVMYNVGYWIGAGMGIGMGFGASGYLPGAGWAVSAATRYTTVATVYAFGQSSVNLATGRFHWTDTFGFLPAIGWGVGKMLGRARPAPGGIQYGTPGDDFLTNASRAEPLDGFLDVAVHGSPTTVEIDEQVVNHRVLAHLIQGNPQFTGQSIRLISCETGILPQGYAQNLSNKLGVVVFAPDDIIWAWPNGALTIGPTPSVNTGLWNFFVPGGGRP